MRKQILTVIVYVAVWTVFMSLAAHAVTKGKAKKSVKSRHKSVAVKPARKPPLLDTTSWSQALSITPCDSDSASILKLSLIREINEWSHVRYRKGGMSKKGIDCSAFVLQVYKNALSMELPRTSREQFHFGDEVEMSDLNVGDLVFFYRTVKKKRISHVGMYIGNGQFVHSALHGGVSLESLSSSYYAKRFAGARRIVSLGSV